MDDEFRIAVDIPLDTDGFLRRQCPNCEHEFKWFSHSEGDPDAEQVTQYFCPLCGCAAGVDEWNTPAQNEYMLGAAGPQLNQYLSEAIGDAFRGAKNITFEANPSFNLELPVADPPHEPNDMVIVEPPCHFNEPVKVPEGSIAVVHCLICGSTFSS